MQVDLLYQTSVKSWFRRIATLLAVILVVIPPAWNTKAFTVWADNDPTPAPTAIIHNDNAIGKANAKQIVHVTDLKGHVGSVVALTVSPDGNVLASGGTDGTVRLWDIQGQKQLMVLQGHTQDVTGVVFSPDGTTLASSSRDETIRLWNIQTGQQIATFNSHIDLLDLSFNNDGTLMAATSIAQVQLWDVKKQSLLSTLQNSGGFSYGALSVAFSPDGNYLATGSADLTVRVWDIHTGTQLAVMRGHTNAIFRVLYSPDGQTIASSSSDKTIYLWDAHTYTSLAVLKGHTKGVSNIAFSPDGTLLASSSLDGTVRLWDVQTGQNLDILNENPGSVFSVAFSGDETTLFSGDQNGNIAVWGIPRHIQ